MADAAERAAKLGGEIRTVADRHRGDVAAAGTVLLNVREVVQTTSKQISQLGELSGRSTTSWSSSSASRRRPTCWH